MREILFRGKRKDNGEWVEGSLIPTTSTMEKPFIVDSCWCYSGSVDDEGYAKFEYLNAYEVIPETVGQYTGLPANGKKIFEGDIVSCKYANAPKNEHIQKVVFFGCKFMAEFSNGGCYSELYDGARHLSFDKSAYMTEIEVIGNIHDNPELMKGGENG